MRCRCGQTDPDRFYTSRPYQCRDCHREAMRHVRRRYEVQRVRVRLGQKRRRFKLSDAPEWALSLLS